MYVKDEIRKKRLFYARGYEAAKVDSIIACLLYTSCQFRHSGIHFAVTNFIIRANFWDVNKILYLISGGNGVYWDKMIESVRKDVDKMGFKTCLLYTSRCV